MSSIHPHRDYAASTELLLRELGYRTGSIERNSDGWTLEFEGKLGFKGRASSSEDMRFLEMSMDFEFSVKEQEFIRQRMESFLEICRHYGCYFDMHTSANEIYISLLSKLYFVALDYYALEESCADLHMATADLSALFDIAAPRGKGNHNGHP